MQGALLIDKPAGPTSHDVVAVVRRALKTPRVGHTGTLDPLATGLLVLLVGPATRLAQFVAADEKEYIADVRLGIATPTYDAAGLAEPGAGGGDRVSGIGMPALADIDAALAHFRGTFMQTPPPFSAKKRDGVPAHERARKQQPVDLAPVEVTVRQLELVEPRSSDTRHPAPDTRHPAPDTRHPAPDTRHPAPDTRARDATLVRLRVAASAGFYVRSLAHDLGQRLGCGAHLEALRRIRAGRLSVVDAIPLDVVVNDPAETRRRMIPPGELLSGLPSAALNEQGVVRTLHGNPLGLNHLIERPAGADPEEFVRLFDGQELLAVGRMTTDGSIHPVVVLAQAPEVKY